MIRYLVLSGILLIFIYELSFVKYQWQRKNKLGAIGTALIAATSLIFPVFLLFLR